jgi:AcrR family transcriptional regulator
MDGFERRKEQSKEDIRHAAEELFSRFGADKVSVNDIAKKAGVSQATIYNNFGSKDELVKDYQHTIIRVLATRFRTILVWKKSWVEKLQGAIQSWLDIADRYKLAMESNPPITGEAANVRAEMENAFKEFLKEGRNQGSLRKDISDEAIISYIRLFQQSIINNPEIYNRTRRDDTFYQELLSLFVYGISGKK